MTLPARSHSTFAPVRLSLALAFVASFSMFSTAPIVAQTGTLVRDIAPRNVISGSVSGTWTKAKSPYHIVGDVLVPTSRNLTIESGVQILLEANIEFRVTGTLNVAGAASDPVVFTNAVQGARWGGLFFDNAESGSDLLYCRVEYSGNAGIRLEQTVVALTNCEIINNERRNRSGSSSEGGGGIWISLASGDLVLRGCKIENNYASNLAGGGLFARMGNGNLVLEDCEILGNRSWEQPVGGGIYVTFGSGNLTMKRCEVSRNSTGAFDSFFGGGGGVYCRGADQILLTDCLFTQNEAHCLYAMKYGHSALGGGIHAESSSLTVRRCVFRQNRAAAEYAYPWSFQSNGLSYGGAIAMTVPLMGAQKLIVDNSVFVGNIAWVLGMTSTVAGAGIYSQGQTFITNSTIARNQNVRADDSVIPGPIPFAGIHIASNKASSSSVTNSIIFGHTSARGLARPFPPELSTTGLASGLQAGSPATSGINMSYSNVQGGYDGVGNLGEEPLFAGASTSCAAVEIVSTSSSVDAGDPTSHFNDVSFPPSLGTTRNDMGANGGPAAGLWANWARPTLTLEMSPRPNPCTSSIANAKTTGGAMAQPVGLYLEAVNGVPLSGGPLLISPLVNFCAAGRWETTLTLPSACNTSSLSLRAHSLDLTGQPISSNDVEW